MATKRKREKATHEPAAWPQVPEYPGDDIVAAVPWLGFGKLTVGNPAITTDPAGWSAVAADWLEEHGQAGLAAVWRHWGLCWTRVDPSGTGVYDLGMGQLCRDMTLLAVAPDEQVWRYAREWWRRLEGDVLDRDTRPLPGGRAKRRPARRGVWRPSESGRRHLLCGRCGWEVWYTRQTGLPVSVNAELTVWAHEDRGDDEGLWCSTCEVMLWRAEEFLPEGEHGLPDAGELRRLVEAGTLAIGDERWG